MEGVYFSDGQKHAIFFQFEYELLMTFLWVLMSGVNMMTSSTMQ